MNNRNKLIITLLLTISLILSTTMPIMAEEITDEIVEVQSVNEEASICSDEEYLPMYSVILVNGYYIQNAPGTYSSRAADAPYTDVVLTSFTNIAEEVNMAEEILIAAEKYDAKKIYVTNTGSITASDISPEHWMNVLGLDGHGEEYYINRNMFDVTDEELTNISLGNKIINNSGGHGYYEPVPGLAVFDLSRARNDNDERYMLTPSIEIVTDNYDYTGNNQEQTWIKITFTKGPDTPEQNKPLTKEEQIKAYKDSFPNRTYLNDNDFIEVASGNEFTGKKLKPEVSIGRTIIRTVDGDDNKISEIYDTIYYSSTNKKQIRVKYKNNKNAGTASAIIKKCNMRPELKDKEIQFEIEPITVSDNNMKPTIKNGTVKSVKVLTGGKYKKVKKDMWKVVNGNVLTFSGNYRGSVSLNGLS